MTRTVEVQRAVENYFLKGPDSKNVKTYFTVAGGGQGVAGQNTGQSFINLADYEKRHGSDNSADAIVQRASGAFRGLRDAQVFALVPGAIRGLGQSGGFTLELQNTGGMSAEQFAAARDRLIAAASADPKLTQVRPTELPDVASLKVDIDQQRLAALGLNAMDVNNTISTAWGGRYVNDFIDRGV
jgi:multidrug efflux pump